MSSTAQPLLRLEGVTKVFYKPTRSRRTRWRRSRHPHGEYLSIAGPSGCGKSTLLAILGLLDSPTDGSYILNSKPVAGI